jgi:hypothetical protein
MQVSPGTFTAKAGMHPRKPFYLSVCMKGKPEVGITSWYFGVIRAFSGMEKAEARESLRPFPDGRDKSPGRLKG